MPLFFRSHDLKMFVADVVIDGDIQCAISSSMSSYVQIASAVDVGTKPVELLGSKPTVFANYNDMIGYVDDIMQQAKITTCAHMAKSKHSPESNLPRHGFMEHCEPRIYEMYIDLIETFSERGFFGTRRYNDFLAIVCGNVSILHDPSNADVVCKNT